MGMAGKPLKVVRTMSNFFENLKNDAEKGWDDLKDSVERVDDAYRENFENNTSDWHNLYSWADGDLIDLPVFSDNPSAKDKTMQTLAYMMMKDNELVSPADGTVTGIDEDNNTIAINLSDKLTVAVKVCVSAVSLKSPEEARSGRRSRQERTASCQICQNPGSQDQDAADRNGHPGAVPGSGRKTGA